MYQHSPTTHKNEVGQSPYLSIGFGATNSRLSVKTPVDSYGCSIKSENIHITFDEDDFFLAFFYHFKILWPHPDALHLYYTVLAILTRFRRAYLSIHSQIKSSEF